MKILLFLLILKWPWHPLCVGDALKAPVVWGNHCGEAVACCDLGLDTIFISLEQDAWKSCGSLERIIIHELQHYFQDQTGMFERNEWEGFRHDVADFVLYDGHDLTEHQRKSLRVFMEDGDNLWELHAELPIIMEGDIPTSLAKWYPWFRGLQ